MEFKEKIEEVGKILKEYQAKNDELEKKGQSLDDGMKKMEEDFATISQTISDLNVKAEAEIRSQAVYHWLPCDLRRETQHYSSSNVHSIIPLSAFL